MTANKLYDNFLKHYDSLDLLLPDCNGVIRGKRIPASAAEKVFSDGVLFPASVFAVDIRGEPCEKTHLGFETGDVDFCCPIIPDSLAPVPWAKNRAQVLLSMHDDKDEPFNCNPREILNSINQRLNNDGYFPKVAVELEFFLFSQDFVQQPKPPINPITKNPETSSQVYYMDDLDAYQDLIDTIGTACEAQNIDAEAAVSECAPGQFEINLKYSGNILKACDDAILLKRVIKQVARQNGFIASFMAKPYANHSGCGSHVHVSCYDESGNNVFAKSTQHLQSAIAGMQQTMAESMLIYAPHANSYRRFQPDSYVAMNNSWGFNNRTVALRVPVSSEHNLRIEHRIAGADANPYLVVAAILSGMHYGLENSLECDAPIEGNAYKKTQATNPTHWQDALNHFKNSQFIENYFNKDFLSVFTTLKQEEMNQFNLAITPLEYEWYLQTI